MHHCLIALLPSPDADIDALMAPFHYEEGNEPNWDWYSLGGRFSRYCPKGPICRKADLVTNDSESDDPNDGPFYAVLAEGVYRERRPWNGKTFKPEDAYDKWYWTFWPSIPADQWVAVVDVHT